MNGIGATTVPTVNAAWPRGTERVIRSGARQFVAKFTDESRFRETRGLLPTLAVASSRAPQRSARSVASRGALQLAASGLVLGLLGALVLAVAGLAAYVPARRATGVDPVTAMRGE